MNIKILLLVVAPPIAFVSFVFFAVAIIESNKNLAYRALGCFLVSLVGTAIGASL